MPVGRSKNADPKWILPMICRLGHVTKKDIGQIRIFDRETKFEISKAAEERFREAIKAAGSTASKTLFNLGLNWRAIGISASDSIASRSSFISVTRLANPPASSGREITEIVSLK